MSEMTPEKLRKLAPKPTLDEVPLEYVGVRWEDIQVAASAWEADRKRLEEAQARIEALDKKQQELVRLLGLAQANEDLTDANVWNDEVDAALAAQEEAFCPACDAGVGSCNGPHRGTAGDIPF